MKKALLSSRNILMVLPQHITIDTAAAAYALAITLQKNSKVTFGTSNAIPKNIQQIFPFHEFKILHELAPREVVVSINRKKGTVKNVRWREVDKKVQFIITPIRGDFEFDDVDLHTTGSNYDLIIFLGCAKKKSAGQIYTKHTDVFKDTKIINIDNNKANTQFGTINKIIKSFSLSDTLLQFFKKEEISLTQKSAETFFKGIFWSNEGFQNDNKLDMAINTVLEHEGNVSKIVASMYNSLSVKQAKYIKAMLGRIKKIADSIAYATIPFKFAKKMERDTIVYPEINLLSRIKDYLTIVIFAEHTKGKTTVYVYSHDTDENLLSKFSEYKPIGKKHKISFTKKGNAQHVEQEILTKLGHTASATSQKKSKNSSKSIKPNSKKNTVTTQTFDIKPEEYQVHNKDATPKKKKGKSPLAKAKKLPKVSEAPANQNRTMPSPPIMQQPTQQTPYFPANPLPPVQQ